MGNVRQYNNEVSLSKSCYMPYQTIESRLAYLELVDDYDDDDDDDDSDDGDGGGEDDDDDDGDDENNDDDYDGDDSHSLSRNLWSLPFSCLYASCTPHHTPYRELLLLTRHAYRVYSHPINSNQSKQAAGDTCYDFPVPKSGPWHL
uniref:Uncharacterized protein n=1 Tax=Branchiostoma floridae TaxID=7739 RepID=C3YKP3_BRAFL|eukprot:XP_002603100.1 hypothetical protein BRAFLDRAFT_63266 [Branchiostoma floridae]